MVGAEEPFSGGEDFLEEGDGVVEPVRSPVDAGEVATAGQGVGVVGAEEPPRLLRRILEDLNGAAEIASLDGDDRQCLLDGERLPRRVVQSGGGQGDVLVCVAGLVEFAEAER